MLGVVISSFIPSKSTVNNIHPCTITNVLEIECFRKLVDQLGIAGTLNSNHGIRAGAKLDNFICSVVSFVISISWEGRRGTHQEYSLAQCRGLGLETRSVEKLQTTEMGIDSGVGFWFAPYYNVGDGLILPGNFVISFSRVRRQVWKAIDGKVKC